MMNWILLVMATIAATIVAMLLGGAMAPRTRRAVRSLHTTRTVADVYATAREVDGPPRWCADLPNMRVITEQAPHELTLVLLDDDGADTGQWHITVQPANGTENGADHAVITVAESVSETNLLLRFLRSLGSGGGRLERFLDALARQLDVPANVRAE